ncbi:adipolin-like [Macrobrachium rosenbergii]|uniref:adipolin-like n=1 Tax=Macrobrachium rosenbergii TaxID=79674 RepID=UPI0034D724B4
MQFGTCNGWVCFSLVVIFSGIRAVEGIRSMVMGPKSRDISLGSNALQGLQSMWYKDSQEDEPSMVLDPRQTWDAFIKNSERTSKLKRRKNRRRNKKNQIPMPKAGPPGPPGPRGPPGPPGGTLTTAELEEYIKDFLREYLQDNDTARVSAEVDDLSGGESMRRGRVKVAFASTLPHPPTIKPAGLSIVDSFTITFSPGLFERRVVVEHGGFTVTKHGLYQVSASLVLHPKGRPNTALIPRNEISAYICVNTCTKDNRRLQWSGSVGDGTVTAVLTGHIMLRRGNTLYVAVDNTSERHLQVGTGSSFSAAMIGT